MIPDGCYRHATQYCVGHNVSTCYAMPARDARTRDKAPNMESPLQKANSHYSHHLHGSNNIFSFHVVGLIGAMEQRPGRSYTHARP